MANIYELRRYGKIAFLIASASVVALFLYFSNGLISDLSAQERERMEIWADATKQIISATSGTGNAGGTDIDFLLSIIQRNTTIPVLLTDSEGNILQHRNFKLPATEGDPRNDEFLKERLDRLRGSSNTIRIELAPGETHYLYYEDSTLLRRLSVFPYIQLLVMLAFIAVVYFAVLSTKKAEQNKVWVGLSKETAHQLGTPISSLMAWMELLPDMGVDPDTVAEINKDVNRLSTIASRFSKIGSAPRMEPADLNVITSEASGYMATRISSKISLRCNTAAGTLPVMACAPLLAWVIENLVKNAVDAMDGNGNITVETKSTITGASIEISDTGKGICRKNFDTIFRPGYTTKKRGWGLGLTLARRIIEEYHGGRIYVARSAPGAGTTFRIDFPRVTNAK